MEIQSGSDPAGFPGKLIDFFRMKITEGAIREGQVAGLLNAVVFASIAAVAYADWWVVAPISLGYLYILPISLSALVNPLPLSGAIAVGCTVLHDAFGPKVTPLSLRITHDVIDLIGFLIAAFVVTLLARERNRLFNEVRRQRDEYENDLALAAQVQRKVLPKPPHVSGFDLAAGMRTARLLGGDYYDFFSLSAEMIDVVIADVSGKGAAAALLMPSLAVALRLRARELGGPAEIIKDFDEALKQITSSATFVTMFYGRLNAATRVLEYSNAGHNPPILLRTKTGARELLDEGGPILGILDTAQYRNAAVTLEPGDILALFTDGVTEQEDLRGEQFSMDRLTELLRGHSHEAAAALVAEATQAVYDYAQTNELSDDLTLVIVKAE